MHVKLGAVKDDFLVVFEVVDPLLSRSPDVLFGLLNNLLCRLLLLSL